jgi:hypothetical protein
VFTARYALSPYIKQIRFVFKGLKHKDLMPVKKKQSKSSSLSLGELLISELSLGKEVCVLWRMVQRDPTMATPDSRNSCNKSHYHRSPQWFTSRQQGLYAPTQRIYTAFFLFQYLGYIRPAMGPTQVSLQWVMGTFVLGVKRPECEANHFNLVLRFKNE